MVSVRVLVSVVGVVLFVVGVFVGYFAGVVSGGATVTSTVTVTSVRTVTLSSVLTTTLTKTTTLTRTTTLTATSTVTASRVVVVDALGRSVVFSRPPRRVVSLAPSITEILFALGCGGRVVGVDSYSNYPPSLLVLEREGRVKVVGSYWKPDLEKIVALHPDVVFADAGVPSQVALAGRLASAGIRVVFLYASKAKDLTDIVRDIMVVATVMGVRDRGVRLVESIKSAINSVVERVSRLPRNRTLVLLGSPKYGVWAAGGGTFIDYVLRAAGGVNVAGRLHGWAYLSYSQLASMNPSVVIISAMAGSAKSARAILEAWAKTPLGRSRAFVNGTVCVFYGPADDVLVRPGPRIAIAVRLVAWVLHPNAVSAPANYTSYVYCVRHG